MRACSSLSHFVAFFSPNSLGVSLSPLLHIRVLDSLGFDWEPCQKRDSVVQAARHKSESDSDKC